MLIIDVHNMRGNETSNNFPADTQPIYNATVTYKYGDEVVFGDYIYYSINRDNTGNQPNANPLYWVIKENINRLKIYDKFPNSLAVNSADTVLKYNVTNIDAIYLGSIHGDSVKVEAGATFNKTIPAKTHSAINAWGVKAYDQIADFYVPLGALYSGTVKITITKSATTKESALGFINYGELNNLGCTLVDSIKYNIRGGAGQDWRNIDLNVFRTSSYQEIKLPIKINETTVFTKDVIEKLSEYRGLPVLVIGDDLGVREETIFFGVYTDLEARIADKNSYNIVLRSLSYKAFVPPTELEQSILDAKKAQEENVENTPPTPATPAIKLGVTDTTTAPPPSVADYGSTMKLIWDENDYYNTWVLDGGASLQLLPKVDSIVGVPAVADFGTGKYRRRVIFDEKNPCNYYYKDGGGTVRKCSAKVTTKAGVPSVADFTSSDFIFNVNSHCDLYYKDGGTVRKCNPTVIAYTGKPPASAFTGGAEFIYDRSNPCDIYYKNGGTVKKCGGDGGGAGGVVGFGGDKNLISKNAKIGELIKLSTPSGSNGYIVSNSSNVKVVGTVGFGKLEVIRGGTVDTYYNGATVTLNSGDIVKTVSSKVKILSI